MKIVFRAGNITEAEIVRGMLLANGIEAYVSGYFLQGGIGEIAPTDLGKVHVQDADFERATALIREYEGDGQESTGAAQQKQGVKSATDNKILYTVVVIIIVSVLGYWFGI